MINSPFDPLNPEGFKRWRDQKLQNYPSSLAEISVEIKNPLALSPAEKTKILSLTGKTNHVLYATDKILKAEDIRKFGQQLGLLAIDQNPFSDDAVSIITDKTESGMSKAGEYIPYTSSAIQWHTDGYYNPPREQIHGFILHCSQDASTGGENEILDNEIVYLFLMEKDPGIVKALMRDDVMVIPANDDKEVTSRPQSRGPVFALSADGSLHMRYTARKKNVVWSEAALFAKTELENFLAAQTPYHFYGKLSPGQGIVTNNSLHRRNSFLDGENQRVMFRARYYDRVTNPPGTKSDRTEKSS